MASRGGLVSDMSFAALRRLPPGAYTVSNAAAGSPRPGSYGNMLVAACEPDGWTARVAGTVAFDDGSAFAIGGWDGALSLVRIDRA